MNLRLATRTIAVVLLAATMAACATGRAFSRGEDAGKAGDWEAAVGFYRQALQDDPDRPDYKIALERAMVAASQMYAERGRAVRRGRPAGRGAARLSQGAGIRAVEPAVARSAAADRTHAARSPGSRRTRGPTSNDCGSRPAASGRADAQPANPEPLIVNFVNTSVRDILTFVGNYTGINVTFDRDFQDRTITLKLEGVSLEQALQQIMIANQLFYRVLNDRTIIVAADNTQKRTQYEEQVIRTFFVSHADATEISRCCTGMVRVAGMAIQPQIVANKTTNTITVRATAPVVRDRRARSSRPTTSRAPK